MSGLAADKHALRQRMLALRESLDDSWRERAGSALVETVRAEVLPPGCPGYLLCLPFRCEPDLSALAYDPPPGGRVYLPRVNWQIRALDLCPFPCPTVVTRIGLREPAAAAPCLAPEEISALVQIALLPGLAFARHTRHRLGYGGGFFDRFRALHPQVRAVGVGFACQVLDAVPHDERDIPMDLLVTEEGLL